MNLAATIEIYAYGTSEGVKKEWDTRGRKGVVLTEYVGKGVKPGKDETPFTIRDNEGKVLGHVIVHLADGRVGEPDGLDDTTLVVDWVQRETGETFNPRTLRDLAKALKEKFPKAETVAGNRITGMHKLAGDKDRQNYYRENWTIVNLRAMAL